MTATIKYLPSAFDPTDIEITDGVDDAFLIKDTSGDEWFKIDTRSGTGENCINMAYTTGQRVLIGKPASAAQGPYSPLQVINQNNDSYAMRIYGDTAYQIDNQLAWGNDSQKPVWIHPQGGRFDSSSSSGSFEFRNSSSLTMLTMDDNSNATFTLDDGSGAAFKVVNDAGSPKTFLSINDGGSTIIDSESVTFFKAQGHLHLRLSSSELQIGASGKFNVMHTGTPMYHRSPNTVSLGATSATTIVNIQADGSNKSFKMNPSTTSQTFTFEFQDSTSSNGGFVAEQLFMIQNYGTQNCTIQATVTSGRGSALGKDLSAGGSTSGELVTGMTLNAGKSAVFKAVKWNKELATPTMADNEFMFQTIMVEA